ncbi:MAG: hypothetical protein H0X37_17155 [Herpetosiphonaceae bacterium]|nr:hypothetical protein [Herpetosiphonaceae bacterium]
MTDAKYTQVLELAEELSIEEQHTLATTLRDRSATRLSQRQRNQAAIDLLDSWDDGTDPDEQRETWEALKEVLDEP